MGEQKKTSEVRERLEEDEKDIHFTDILEKDSGGYTALNEALFRHNLEIINFFLESGYDTSNKSNSNSTALHYASIWGNLEVVKLLVEYGSDIEVVNNDGNTPIDVAREEKIKEHIN